jgi:hypothetical protein
MDVQIEEISSSVKVADSGALLDPNVIKRLVRMVMQGMKDMQTHEKRVNEERGLQQSSGSED